VRRALAWSLVLFFALSGARALADHVSAAPEVSGHLGERNSDLSWSVAIDWAVNCSGPAPGNANYFGSLNLDDVDTGEVVYGGGISSAAGSDSLPVGRRAQPRHMRPRLKASCSDGGISNHGSETIEVTGNVVTVPALGDENGDGVIDPPPTGGGGSPPPPGGGTPQPTGGGDGPCAARFEGTPDGDIIDGTSAGDHMLGRGGDDILRAAGGDDCLYGDAGNDLLVGGPGSDRLTGGGGADRLGAGSGDDRLTGGPGRDRLAGGHGADRLSGGGGDDRLNGGSGVNRYSAGAGRDVVDARNRRAEVVSCGAGRDRARVDRRDTVRGCERVRRG
jgi:Ca2+-binding RTX toxin-like protein